MITGVTTERDSVYNHTLFHTDIFTDLATIDALEEPNFRKLALIC